MPFARWNIKNLSKRKKENFNFTIYCFCLNFNSCKSHKTLNFPSQFSSLVFQLCLFTTTLNDTDIIFNSEWGRNETMFPLKIHGDSVEREIATVLWLLKYSVCKLN